MSPLTLGAVLFRIVIMFFAPGGATLELPLAIDLVVMFLFSFWMGRG